VLHKQSLSQRAESFDIKLGDWQIKVEIIAFEDLAALAPFGSKTFQRTND
jgi:hypothetical protein